MGRRFDEIEDELVIEANTFQKATRLGKRLNRTPQTIWNRHKLLEARGMKPKQKKELRLPHWLTKERLMAGR